MAEYTDSLEEFKHAKDICHRLVEIDRTVPAMVFKTDFDYYYFAEYDMLFTQRGPYWEHVLMLARKPNTGRLVFLVLDPDPESYYSWCNRYGTVLTDPRAERDDILEILSKSPKEGTGDAMCFIARRFVVFSERSLNWCLWADSYYEVAILAINDCSTRQAIEETLNDGWYSAEQAIDRLPPIPFFVKPTDERLREEFLANYGD